MILEEEEKNVGIEDNFGHPAGSIRFRRRPFIERLQKLLNGLLFRPEVSVQHGDIGYRSGALLGHELLERGVSGGGVRDPCGLLFRPTVLSLAIYVGHSVT